jgi:hypothetical protein
MAIRFSDATNSGIEVTPLVASGSALASASDMTRLLDWMTDPSAGDYVSEELAAFSG